MEMMEIVFWSVQGTYVQYIRTYVLKSVKAIMICFLVDVKVSDINQSANDQRISEANSFSIAQENPDLTYPPAYF